MVDGRWSVNGIGIAWLVLVAVDVQYVLYRYMGKGQLTGGCLFAREMVVMWPLGMYLPTFYDCAS